MVGDHTPPFLPGLYASLSKKYYSEGRTRTGYYIRLDENPYVDYRPAPDRYKRTACFIGSLANHPVRQELKKHAWGDVLIEDTSDFATRMLTVSPEEKALGSGRTMPMPWRTLPSLSARAGKGRVAFGSSKH